MSDLPEDMKDWPRNCFGIFGLSKSTTDKELRRSYFRLLKKYKPDTHPAEFQKIHNAYQLARQLLANQSQINERQEFWDKDHDSQTPRANAEKVAGDPPMATGAADAPELSPAMPDSGEVVPNFMDQFWQFASQGLADEAVALMPSITEQRDRDQAGFAEYFLRRAAADRQEPEEAKRRIEILLQYLQQPQLQQNALY